MKQGALYPQIQMSHSDVITEVKYLANTIQLEDTIRAFLYSLSTGANEYRTALASLLYAKSLPEHEGILHNSHSFEKRCAICGLKMDESLSCEIVNSNYNRYRYFPDRYQDICRADYVLFDLQQFQLLPKVNFIPADLEILNRIFCLVEELTSSNKIVALQKMITAEKIVSAGIYLMRSIRFGMK